MNGFRYFLIGAVFADGIRVELVFRARRLSKAVGAAGAYHRSERQYGGGRKPVRYYFPRGKDGAETHPWGARYRTVTV